MRKFSALILVLALICSCTGDKYIAIRGYAQGGVYQVKLNLRGVKEDPRAIKENIDSLLSKIDFTLSGYNKESMLSKFNRGEQVSPDAMFKDIYALSYRLWEESGGAFDVAAGPLYDAWGFGFSKDSLPSDAKVAQLLATCGMAHMPQDADSLVADGVKRLNFNAIAQGYSCDVVASYLYGIGVKDMLVDIGEIFCDGLNPSGKPWTIAVDTPIDGNQTPGESTSGLWSSDGGPHGVVTSGNYRKFYIKDGRKYSHTIDPRNGYLVSHQLLSATIIAPRGAEADAYATFCMVIGLDKAREFIDSRPDLEGMLIYEKDGEMRSWRSGGF